MSQASPLSGCGKNENNHRDLDWDGKRICVYFCKVKFMTE